jgi:hypothetical protein
MKTMLGTAKADITPPDAVPLAGFSSRIDVFEEIARPLCMRVWLFKQEPNDSGERRLALLIQADLIWWGTDHVQALKHRIRDRWGIGPEFVFFHASHTHGGPQTTDEFSPLLGITSPAYLVFLEQTLDRAIAEAFGNVETIVMEKGTGRCAEISINRRNIVNGKAVGGPNIDGPNDSEVTVIRFITEAGRTKGLLFHFTCHPTTSSANRLDSDYCGAAMELIDRVYGDGVSCFLQGCCGDIRPNLHRDGHFYYGTSNDSGRSGAVLAEAVELVLRNPMTRLVPNRVEGWLSQIDLPLQSIPLNEFTSDIPNDHEIVQIWHSMMNNRMKSSSQGAVILHAQLLKLADGFALLGLNGEVVIEYGLWIKSRSSGQLLPLGYSNGMAGYIPTAAQIGEGGYESVTSGYLFGFPAPFAENVEIRLKESIDGLIEKFSVTHTIGE